MGEALQQPKINDKDLQNQRYFAHKFRAIRDNSSQKLVDLREYKDQMMLKEVQSLECRLDQLSVRFHTFIKFCIEKGAIQGVSLEKTDTLEFLTRQANNSLKLPPELEMTSDRVTFNGDTLLQSRIRKLYNLVGKTYQDYIKQAEKIENQAKSSVQPSVDVLHAVEQHSLRSEQFNHYIDAILDDIKLSDYLDTDFTEENLNPGI